MASAEKAKTSHGTEIKQEGGGHTATADASSAPAESAAQPASSSGSAGGAQPGNAQPVASAGQPQATAGLSLFTSSFDCEVD